MLRSTQDKTNVNPRPPDQERRPIDDPRSSSTRTPSPGSIRLSRHEGIQRVSALHNVSTPRSLLHEIISHRIQVSTGAEAHQVGNESLSGGIVTPGSTAPSVHDQSIGPLRKWIIPGTRIPTFTSHAWLNARADDTDRLLRNPILVDGQLIIAAVIPNCGYCPDPRDILVPLDKAKIVGRDEAALTLSISVCDREPPLRLDLQFINPADYRQGQFISNLIEFGTPIPASVRIDGQILHQLSTNALPSTEPTEDDLQSVDCGQPQNLSTAEIEDPPSILNVAFLESSSDDLDPDEISTDEPFVGDIFENEDPVVSPLPIRKDASKPTSWSPLATSTPCKIPAAGYWPVIDDNYGHSSLLPLQVRHVNAGSPHGFHGFFRRLSNIIQGLPISTPRQSPASVDHGRIAVDDAVGERDALPLQPPDSVPPTANPTSAAIEAPPNPVPAPPGNPEAPSGTQLNSPFRTNRLLAGPFTPPRRVPRPQEQVDRLQRELERQVLKTEAAQLETQEARELLRGETARRQAVERELDRLRVAHRAITQTDRTDDDEERDIQENGILNEEGAGDEAIDNPLVDASLNDMSNIVPRAAVNEPRPPTGEDSTGIQKVSSAEDCIDEMPPLGGKIDEGRIAGGGDEARDAFYNPVLDLPMDFDVDGAEDGMND